jgi:hypothetical protein
VKVTFQVLYFEQVGLVFNARAILDGHIATLQGIVEQFFIKLLVGLDQVEHVQSVFMDLLFLIDLRKVLYVISYKIQRLLIFGLALFETVL